MEANNTSYHDCRKCGRGFNYELTPDRVFKCPGCKRRYEIKSGNLIIRGDLFTDDTRFQKSMRSDYQPSFIRVCVMKYGPFTIFALFAIGLIIPVIFAIREDNSRANKSYSTFPPALGNSSTSRGQTKLTATEKTKTAPVNREISSEDLTERTNNNVFEYNGLVLKGWTYYVRRDGSFSPMTLTHPQYDEVVAHFQPLISATKNLRIEHNTVDAELTVTTSDGVYSHVLQKRTETIYSVEDRDKAIIFKIISGNKCEVYFCRGELAVGIANTMIDL